MSIVYLLSFAMFGYIAYLYFKGIKLTVTETEFTQADVIVKLKNRLSYLFGSHF
jgi:hypothetical protein